MLTEAEIRGCSNHRSHSRSHGPNFGKGKGR